jgi:hypothetical protein
MRACTPCCPAAWGSFQSRMSHARSDTDRISKHTGGRAASASSSSQRSRAAAGTAALASIVLTPPSCVWVPYHGQDRYTGDEDGRAPPKASPWDARRGQLRAWVQDHRDALIDVSSTNVPNAQRKCCRFVTDFLEQMCRVFASHLSHACGRCDARWAGESCGGDASGALCYVCFDQVAGTPDGTHL